LQGKAIRKTHLMIDSYDQLSAIFQAKVLQYNRLETEVGIFLKKYFTLIIFSYFTFFIGEDLVPEQTSQGKEAGQKIQISPKLLHGIIKYEDVTTVHIVL